jgi:hypothetical protein
MSCKKHYAAAQCFYGAAFAAEPKLAENLNAQHRYNAACAAARAGCGQGEDAAQLDEQKRASWRRQALEWLRAHLTAWNQRLERDPSKAAPAVRKQMQHWQQDAEFAGVRGTEALSRLPEDERPAWQRLWADVEKTLAKAQGKSRPGEKSHEKP